MRTVRVTGVTGTSAWVPLDAYSPDRAVATSNQAALGVEWTADNVFDTSITPVPVAAVMATGFFAIPNGARAIRGTGMVGADVLVVSQQGLG